MSHSNNELELNGSACTVFNDPENSTSVNEGVTLIPWMGDTDSMIDRYDVRGHLYSEAEFGMRRNETDVDAEESRLEAELDKERYMFLTIDELEFEAYLEEEEKRFNKKKFQFEGSYGQVGFSYNKPESGDPGASDQPSVIEEIYVPAKKLAVPDDMTCPKTMKHYKIIEKTAGFLSTQSLQTEIVIRTKQKNNAQFQFLEPGNELNLFYKLVLSAVKRKIIIVESAPKPVTPVVPKPAPQPAPQPYNQPPQPSFQPPQAQWPEQPGAHNQYHQQLIQFGANQVQQSAPHQPQVQLQAPPQFSVPQQQPPPQRGGGQWGKIAGEHLHQGEAKKGLGSSLAALSAYSDSDDSDSENEGPSLNNIISGMSKPIPVPPGTSPEVIQYLIMSGFVALPPPGPGLPQLLVPPAGYEGFTIPTLPPPPPPQEEVHVTREDSEEESQEMERPSSPSPEQKGIITKLAEYVVKNGDSFERKVLQKKDERFAFVNPRDKDHAYYQYLIQKFRNKRVKLNVAPIKLKAKQSQRKPTGPVDNTVFNQSSSEEEGEKEKEAQPEQPEKPPVQKRQSRSPSPDYQPSPTHTQQTTSQESVSQDSVSQDYSSQDYKVEKYTSKEPASSPHPLDSPPRLQTPPKETHNRTPVYTHDTSTRTPSPTPQDTRSRTPEPTTNSPTAPAESESESVDSETKGRPLVQHFDDEDSDHASRYDLDEGRSPTPSPSRRSLSRDGSRSRSLSRDRRSRSRTPDVKRSRTKTRSYSRSPVRNRSGTPDSHHSSRVSEREEIEKNREFLRQKEEDLAKREDALKREILRQKEEDLAKREEALKRKEQELKQKEDEVPEEGEISDRSSRKKPKKDRRERSASRQKKNRKDKSRKRDIKSPEPEYRSASAKKHKGDRESRAEKSDQKRKRATSPMRSETEDWMSDKMKKLSKIELLKEIETKLEEKKKLRDKKKRESSDERTKKKDAGPGKVREIKEKEAVVEKCEKKEKERNGKSSEKEKKEQKPIEKEKKESKPNELDTSKLDEEKKIAMERELAEIEAKLEAKKVKRQKELSEDAKKKNGVKVNGHPDKSKKKKAKTKETSSRSKKS